MERSGNPGSSKKAGEQLTMIETYDEIVESEPLQHFVHRRQQLNLHRERRRANGVDIALIELAEPPARRTVRTPDRLYLVSLEKARQLVLILRNYARQRNSQVVPEGQIGLPPALVLAAPQNLEDQLVAFVAVLAQQRLDVLERRRLEWLEAVALVHLADDTNDVLPAADVGRQEVSRASRWLR